jgi:hypothetical protein
MLRRGSRVVVSIVTGALALACLVVGSAQAPDPVVGTWKMNPAQSKYSPGPPPKDMTVVIESAGQGLSVTVEIVAPDGTSTKTSYTTAGDGKDVPVTGNPAFDAAGVVRKDLRHATTEYKREGKVILTVVTTISADGKTLTTDVKGLTPDGKPLENVVVFEKQ